VGYVYYEYTLPLPFYIFFVLITLMMAGLNSMLFFEYKLTFWEYLSLFIGSIIICIFWQYYLSTQKQFLKDINRKLIERNYDELTKVKNLRSLNEDVDSMTDVEKEKLIFVMMDLDHFKRINDHYGHITGNRALIFFSKKITTFLSEAHQDQVEVYRYGAEEFLVIFKDSTLKSVKKTILRF